MVQGKGSDETSGRGPGDGHGPGVPRWVKGIGIVMAALAALLILARISGITGEHGPGRHVGGLAPAVAVGSPLGGPGW